ncbi:nuclear mitotic apparatus protein 1-like isoform X2 [Anneissia japonica]|uniref:nuclear mitotic apparatus protein 1-like isoform X2 n=1 Tax=Anneissia japonica TaxID=1529436 RepID=UPI001425B045|nr:nuclear mitotic apparatus protein 1-like isoform X2 [Anneissia japonica]
MPLDKGKLRCLVNWINSIGVGDCIESLQQLNDGMHFIAILKIINGDNGTSYCDMPTQRFRLVNTFLEGHYNINNLSAVLKLDRICKGDILELAKVTSLLLCAAVQCPSNENFVEPITKLDQGSQMDLMEIIQHVIQAEENMSLRHDFADILYKKGESMSSDDSTTMADAASPTLPMFIPESPFIRQCLNQSPMMSPIRKFMRSPQMAQKISLRKFQDRAKKLELRIGEEIALRQDREAELKEKCAVINSQELKIRELLADKSSHRHLQDEADEHQATKVELEKVQREVIRLRKKTAITGESRTMVAHLEKQVENLMAEKDELQTVVKNYDFIRSEHERLKVSLHKADFTNEGLQNTVTQLRQEMELLVNSKEEISNTALQKQQILLEKIAELEGELAEKNSLNKSLGESMGMLTDRRVLDLEDELENTKKTFDANYMEVKTQLNQAQSHISGLETKIEHSQQQCNTLSTSLKESQQRCNGLQQTVHTVQEQAILLQTEKDYLRTELTAVRSEKEEASSCLSRVREQLELNRQQCTSLSTDLKESQQRCESLQNTILTVNQQAVLLQTKNEHLQKELTSVRSMKEEALTSLSKITEQLDLSKQQCSSLSTNLKGSQQRCESLQNTVFTVNQQAVLLQTKNDQLQKELSAVTSEKKEALTILASVREQLEEEKSVKEKKISDRILEYNNLQTKFENSESLLLQQIKVATDEKEKLRTELEKVQTEKQAIIAEMENQVRGLREELSHQGTVVEKLELAKSQSDKMELEHQQMMKEVMNQLQMKNETIVNLESQMDVKVSEMQRNLANKDSKIEKLKADLDAVITSLQADLRQKEVTLGKVNEEFNYMSEKVNAEQEKNTGLVEEISILSTELENIKESNGRKINELTEKLNEVTANLQHASCSNNALQEQFDLANSKHQSEMNRQNAQFLEMKVILETEVTEERNLTKNLKEELNRKTSEWEQREAGLIKDIKEGTILLSGEQRKCQNLKEELETLCEESNKNAEKNHCSMQKREDELKQKNAELKNKMNELEMQYEQNLSAMEFSSKEMRRKWEELRKNSEERHEKEIVELQERYNREIETTKRGEAVKADLLKQELEAAKLELTQTKKQCKRELDSLKEKKKVLEITANEQLAAKHKEMEKELHSYKKRMEKEAQQYKAKAEKLQKDLTKTCTDANAYKSDLERQANEKLQEMKKELEKEKGNFSEKIFSLENENHVMKCNLEKLHAKALTDNTELMEERSAKEHLAQRVRSLQTQLDFADRQLREKSNSVSSTKSDVLDESAASHSMDSLDGSLGLSMEDLRPSSRASLASLDSNASGVSTRSRSKSRTTIIINMSKTSTSLNTTQEPNPASTSIVSKDQSHLSIANPNASKYSFTRSQLSLASSLGPDYPDSLSRTLDELSASQNLLQSKKFDSPKYRATTGKGRLGFFITNSHQNEEPDDFDWDRISELKRRNTLCLPHLQTSYPAETQACEKADINLKTTAVLEGAAGVPTYQLRQTRKRKSDGLDDLQRSSKLRPPTSTTFTVPNAMPPKPKKVGPSRRPLQTISVNEEKPKEPEVLKKELEVVNTRRESTAFSIGFSPKPQFKRRSTRMSFGKGFLKSNKPSENKNKPKPDEGKGTPVMKTPKNGNSRRRTIGNMLKWKE